MEEKVKEIEKEAVEETTVENVAIETVADKTIEEEVTAFDPQAFVESSEMVDSPTIKKDVTENEDGDIQDKDSDDFVWGSEKTEETPETKTKDTVVETQAPVIDFEKIGIDGVKNQEDFNKKMDEWKSLEAKSKENALKNTTSDKINKLQKFLNLDDRDLLKKDLELQGFSEEKLNEAIGTYEYNNTVAIEAQKIRNTLNKAIKNEKYKEIEGRKQADAKQEAERLKSISELKDHLNNTETMFGFKMAKDSEGLEKARSEHFEYITSGSFLNNIMNSNSNLTEAAWLWKNKDTILKAMKNKGYQNGKKEILDNIQMPEIPGTTRILDPTGKTNDFNPNAFMFGE